MNVIQMVCVLAVNVIQMVCVLAAESLTRGDSAVCHLNLSDKVTHPTSVSVH